MANKKFGVDIDMDSNQIVNLPAPVNSGDAARKGYVDAHTNNTSNPHSTTLEQVRTAGNQVSGQIDMNNNKIINVGTPTSAGDAATKSYVDGLVDGSLKQPEAYDPTVTSNYPITYAGGVVEAGDTFRITAAGTMGTVTVNVEDLLIALVDAPAQLDTNWQVVESNRTQASETIKGVAELATQSETNTGTNDLTIVTPLKLANKLLNYSAAKVYHNASVVLAGNGTPLTITHNLALSASTACIVSCYLAGEEVTYKVVCINANEITVAKNGAGATIEVTIIGL